MGGVAVPDDDVGQIHLTEAPGFSILRRGGALCNVHCDGRAHDVAVLHKLPCERGEEARAAATGRRLGLRRRTDPAPVPLPVTFQSHELPLCSCLLIIEFKLRCRARRNEKQHPVKEDSCGLGAELGPRDMKLYASDHAGLYDEREIEQQLERLGLHAEVAEQHVPVEHIKLKLLLGQVD
eukprot:scaffold249325_cov30-Tisochrysis_lutea.AAC.1